MLEAAERLLPPMAPRPARVVSRHRETADTVTFGVRPLDGEPLSSEPGRFSMLYAFGIGEVPISVSGAHDGAVVHTVRAVGAVTRAICATPVGGLMGVRGPFGTGWDVASAEGADVLIVGGGLGLAPLRPVVEQVLARRARFGRVVVLAGARAPEHLLFRRDLEAWRARDDIDLGAIVDAASPEWRGDVGLITELVARARFDAADTVAFVCGPEVMMRFVALALQDRGVSAGSIRLSMERNMKCAIAHCGHCQLGPLFICREGPVLSYEQLAPMLGIREL